MNYISLKKNCCFSKSSSNQMCQNPQKLLFLKTLMFWFSLNSFSAQSCLHFEHKMHQSFLRFTYKWTFSKGLNKFESWISCFFSQVSHCLNEIMELCHAFSILLITHAASMTEREMAQMDKLSQVGFKTTSIWMNRHRDEE